MLYPHAMRRRRALHEAVDVLGDRIVRLLRRRILGPHALAAQAPACAGILGEPDAAGGNRDPGALGIARVDADGMKAGQVRPAAHPLLALGMIPQRADHFPALAVIARTEKPARQSPTPDDTGLVDTARGERPDARRAPIERP